MDENSICSCVDEAGVARLRTAAAVGWTCRKSHLRELRTATHLTLIAATLARTRVVPSYSKVNYTDIAA